jgi:hypothetical protein
MPWFCSIMVSISVPAQKIPYLAAGDIPFNLNQNQRLQKDVTS